MRKISIAFNAAEYNALTILARQHGGSLSAAVRSLLHKETVTKALTDSVIGSVSAEFKAAITPLIEANDQAIKSMAAATEINRMNLLALAANINEMLKK